MKKINQITVLAVLALSPTLVSAQWNAVRFDSSNTFTQIQAITASTVFTLGTEPITGQFFFIRTPDGGATWDSIGINTSSVTYQMYEMHFADANIGLIGGFKNNANQGLLRTTDNGTTWTDVTPSPNSTDQITAVFVMNSLVAYAAAGTTLYKSIDGCQTWTSTALSFYLNDLNFVNDSIGFACGNSNTMSSINMQTLDGGATWICQLGVSDPNLFVSNFQLLDVIDVNTIYVSLQYTNRLYLSIDGGSNWQTVTCDSVFDIIDFHFSSIDSGHVLSSYGQLYATTDGGATWQLEYATEWAMYGPVYYLNALSFVDNIGYMCGLSGLIKRHDELPSGFSEMNTEPSSLTIFPNPCYRLPYFSIAMKGLAGESTLVITNSVGQTVFEETIQNSEMNESHDVAIAGFAAGMYSVVVMNQDQTRTNKLIIAD